MALNFGPDTAMTGDVAPADCAPLPVEEIAPHFPELEIHECLGRGGMGVVYKARQKSLGRLVALKVLAPERERDPQFAQRFAREAQALAVLNHPHIVTVHDFGERDGFFYLLMEYVDGVNLRQLLRSRKLSPEEALAIVPPICEALQFAHERGIVHCDIKPENLLLDQAGRVKIADFGIARMLGATAAEEQAAGTPGYMAPEQKTTPQQVDSRADIYALGVVFYEMLTGDLPGEKFQIPSRKVQVDVRLDEIVLRALERSPELRFQTAADLRTHVEAVVNEPHASVPGDRTDAPQITRTGVALAVTWGYAALAFILLLEVLNVLRLSGLGLVVVVVLAFIAAIIGAVPVAARLMQRQQQVDHESASPLWLNISAAAATVLSLPAIAFSVFFVISMLGESGRWNPAVSEAVVVSAALLASFLLPAAAWHLWRTASPRAGGASGGSRFWLKLAFALLIVPVVAFLVATIPYFLVSEDPSPRPTPVVEGMAGISAIHAQGHAVYMVQDEDKLDYAIFYPGRFDLGNSTTRSATRPNGTWVEEGGLTLSTGRFFAFKRDSEKPDTLTINGRAYVLTEGRLFVLKDNGSVEQRIARPGPITRENLPGLAQSSRSPSAPNPASVQAIEVEAARQKLAQVRKRFGAGLLKALDVAEAEYQVAVAEAVFRGDRLGGPQARVRFAKERLHDAQLRLESGSGTPEEAAEAKLELARAEAELRRLESEGN